MSNAPQDPAEGTVDQSKSYDESFKGPEGFAEYQQERFQNTEDVQQTPDSGRSGSFEASNTGGYGAGSVGETGQGGANDQAVVPPDPELQQGQGGQ